MNGNHRILGARRLMLLSVSACVAIPGAAFAQEAAPPATTATPVATAEASPTDAGEIIVTARKRAETLIDVPVTVTAVGATELQARAINNVDAVARIVPTLIAGEGGGTVQGGIISIRGLAGADNNPLGDQAVSFNIDGVGIGRATVRRMSDFDVQQIEVLKGPQALFFGKNSPAGIVSIRTADPTSHFEAQIRAGYEFHADEFRTEAYVSGPITDSLGVRVAGIFSDMKGWAKSYVPRSAGMEDFIHSPKHFRAPNKTDYALRGTMTYDDGGPFSARLKMSFAEVRGAASTANTQFVACPLGFPQASPPAALGLPIDDCRADDKVGVGEFSGNLHGFDPAYPADGLSYLNQSQRLGSLELNYDILDDLTLTSVTGYYKVHLRNLGNFTQNYYEDNSLFSLPATAPNGPPALNVPRQILVSLNELDLREITEEVRLTSNFKGPFNFMLGGLYQDSHGRNGSTTARRTFDPIWVNKYLYIQDGKAWSLFGQGQLKILSNLELSGGVRYSHETKELPGLFSSQFSTTSNGVLAPNASPSALVPITNPNLIRKISFKDWSPEATISYKPTRDMNIYASYKRGFLSGGFSALAPTLGVFYGGTPAGCTTPAGGTTCVPYPVQQVTYDQQVTKGFEVGFKAALFDRALRFNIAAYNYKTSGLQVGVTTQGTQQEIRNAGSVRTKGVEADVNYRTPIEGLSLAGALAYTKGRYLDYQASCYRGQSSSTCFMQTSEVTGLPALLQDLSGQPLVRAPEWTGNASFNYETPISSGLKIGLFGGMNFSSKYFTDTTNTPGGVQKSYTLFDASIRLADVDDRWEAAVIGRNLTNRHYFVRSSDTPFTGTAPGAAPIGILGDTAASINRGREVMLRLTYKFGG